MPSDSMRVDTWISELTTDGFTINCKSWGDAVTPRVGVSWVASWEDEKADPTLQHGTVSVGRLSNDHHCGEGRRDTGHRSRAIGGVCDVEAVEIVCNALQLHPCLWRVHYKRSSSCGAQDARRSALRHSCLMTYLTLYSVREQLRHCTREAALCH